MQFRGEAIEWKYERKTAIAEIYEVIYILAEVTYETTKNAVNQREVVNEGSFYFRNIHKSYKKLCVGIRVNNCDTFSEYSAYTDLFLATAVRRFEDIKKEKYSYFCCFFFDSKKIFNNNSINWRYRCCLLLHKIEE